MTDVTRGEDDSHATAAQFTLEHVIAQAKQRRHFKLRWTTARQGHGVHPAGDIMLRRFMQLLADDPRELR